ncbi:hypothetical protein HDU82_007865 [Entophlyctis luteolus]|nr:hypothetical protein HDU82_007865 [Entophlyctis luteolus]
MSGKFSATVIPLVDIKSEPRQPPLAADGKWETPVRKPHVEHKQLSFASEHWGDLLKLNNRASVVPACALPVLVSTVWATAVCIFTLVPEVGFLGSTTLRMPNSMTLVSLLGTYISLLVAFRLNTAYDRFWEGRKTWSNMQTQIRQLARLIWVYVPVHTDGDLERKRAAMHLLTAFATATKHELRGETHYARYVDLGPHFANMPLVAGDISQHEQPTDAKPTMRIAAALQAFVFDTPSIVPPCTAAVNSLVEQLCVLERIRNTPIPAAYSSMLDQSLVLYLASLPFQLVLSPLKWFTIPITLIVTFVVVGIVLIADNIENPFGLDPNDLPQDEYCDAIAAEIDQIMYWH